MTDKGLSLDSYLGGQKVPRGQIEPIKSLDEIREGTNLVLTHLKPRKTNPSFPQTGTFVYLEVEYVMPSFGKLLVVPRFCVEGTYSSENDSVVVSDSDDSSISRSPDRDVRVYTLTKYQIEQGRVFKLSTQK